VGCPLEDRAQVQIRDQGAKTGDSASKSQFREGRGAGKSTTPGGSGKACLFFDRDKALFTIGVSEGLYESGLWLSIPA
jgi:hypothetical protein